MDDRITKGDYSYGDPKLFGGKSKVVVGKFCSISNNATIDCGFQHGSSYISCFPFPQKVEGLEQFSDRTHTSKGDVIIGNDVWICDNAYIGSGVTIGDGAIIGFGAVVTKNVEPYSVIVGNPAITVKFRFSQEAIEKLLKIKWWDWTIEKIKENVDLLMSSNIESFLSNHT